MYLEKWWTSNFKQQRAQTLEGLYSFENLHDKKELWVSRGELGVPTRILYSGFI